MDNIPAEALKAMRLALEAILDAECELAQDEVSELTSSALDRKLERARKALEEFLK